MTAVGAAIDEAADVEISTDRPHRPPVEIGHAPARAQAQIVAATSSPTERDPDLPLATSRWIRSLARPPCNFQSKVRGGSGHGLRRCHRDCTTVASVLMSRQPCPDLLADHLASSDLRSEREDAGRFQSRTSIRSQRDARHADRDWTFRPLGNAEESKILTLAIGTTPEREMLSTRLRRKSLDEIKEFSGLDLVRNDASVAR